VDRNEVKRFLANIKETINKRDLHWGMTEPML